MSKKKKRIKYFEKKNMASSEEDTSRGKEEAAIPKKNRRTLVRQHFEMRPVLVEFNTTFPNLMNYFSHPLSLKTWKLSDMHVIVYYQISILVNCSRSDVIHTFKSILLSKSNSGPPRNRNLTCDLDDIVLSKSNPPMTRPGSLQVW